MTSTPTSIIEIAMHQEIIDPKLEKLGSSNDTPVVVLDNGIYRQPLFPSHYSGSASGDNAVVPSYPSAYLPGMSNHAASTSMSNLGRMTDSPFDDPSSSDPGHSTITSEEGPSGGMDYLENKEASMPNGDTDGEPLGLERGMGRAVVPSSPLVNSHVDGRVHRLGETSIPEDDEPGETEEGAGNEMDGRGETDIADWHPLELTRSDSKSAARIHDRSDSLSQPQGEGTSSPRSGPPRFRHDLKPPSPQPWDLIDPPSTHRSVTDYYSTIGTKKKLGSHKPTHARPVIPHSSYYFGPPPADSAYGTPPIGQIGVHHPREIVRIERDYSGGELPQFSSTYPLELEGRISPTHFLETINAINEILISAYRLRHSFYDNILAVFTLQLSRLFFTSRYDKEMDRLKHLIDEINVELYNPVGLNIIWPRKVAFLFVGGLSRFHARVLY